jgi:hypothetical protein
LVLAHGYFLIGPFVKLGPLRNSDIGLLAGFLSTIGLDLNFNIRFNYLWGRYFWSRYSTESSVADTDLQSKKAWDQFKGGFFVGACGSAGFAFICLSSIPTFTISLKIS